MFNAILTHLGLFGIPLLRNAKGWNVLTDNVLLKSESLLSKIQNENNPKKIIHTLDNISEILCSVVDPAELCRNVHPSEDYVFSSTESIDRITTYIHQLNTNPKVYEILCRAIKNT